MRRFVLYGGVGFFLIVVVYILQKRMLGLTPEFVKSSINGFMSTSLERAKDYYQHYVQPPIVPEDSVKPPSFDSDDPDGAETGDLIKAAREVSEEQHRPHSPELDPSSREDEESEETSFPDDGGGHVTEHESSPDEDSRRGLEEELDRREDRDAAEEEIEQAATEGIADPLEEQNAVSDASDDAAERPEQPVEEDEPRLVVPTHEETDAPRRGEPDEGGVDENADEEDEYLDVESEIDPLGDKDEL